GEIFAVGTQQCFGARNGNTNIAAQGYRSHFVKHAKARTLEHGPDQWVCMLVPVGRHRIGLACPIGIWVTSLVGRDHVSVAGEVRGLGEFLSAEVQVDQSPAWFGFDQGSERCVESKYVFRVGRLVATSLRLEGRQHAPIPPVIADGKIKGFELVKRYFKYA